jgi:hypothetical protein
VLKPWHRAPWWVPPGSAELVWRLEDRVDRDAEPDDRRSPVGCCEESPDPGMSEVRPARPVAPGRPARYADASRREGTCHLWLVCQPLAGWRPVEVTDRRTARAVAQGMNAMVDCHVPQAVRSRGGLDHVHTHTPAALAEACPPAEARRMLRKRDWSDTPQHGREFNRADIEPRSWLTPGWIAGGRIRLSSVQPSAGGGWPPRGQGPHSRPLSHRPGAPPTPAALSIMIAMVNY